MDFKKLVPHLIAVAALLAVACIFFAPNAFSGKVLAQPDNDKARGMQTEIMEFAKTGDAPLWTNSAFGGMPSFQIWTPIHGNLTTPLAKVFYLFQGISDVWAVLFVAMFCMYLFLVTMRLDWRVALFGALAFGVTTYNVDIIEAGHSTKMSALAFAPGIFAGLMLIDRARYVLGGGIMAFFAAVQINANHIQITYYTLLIVGIFFLIEFVWAFRHRGVPNWGLRALTALLAIVIGFLSNTSRLWPTYEYSQETIRGGSELSSRKAQGTGLTEEYAFGWSYGKAESMTLLVPRAYGGGAGETMPNTEFYKKVSQGRSPGEKAQIARQIASTFYYGDQPFVGTAIYFGAIVCFLFLFGAFVEPGVQKWWLLSAGIFSLMLAWGSNFFLNSILFDYFPMFNKFRAVSMALGLGQLFFAALAALGLQKLFDEDISVQHKQKSLFIAVGATVFLCLVVIMMAGGAGKNDLELAEQLKMPNLPDILSGDRAALARSDAFRSIAFILAAGAMMWLYLNGRMKTGITVLSVAALSLVDNWTVCTRTLTADKYEDAKGAMAPPKPKDYDLKIKEDKDPHYRVLDFSRGGITSNAITSYFHKSLSGYHAAKLQRYQEVVDTFLGADLNKNLHIVGMLNGKYLITQDGQVMPNPKAAGNAWFVKNFKIVQNADEEFSSLHTLDPKETAVVQDQYAFQIRGLDLKPDTAASIKLTKYHPDKMEYEYSSNSTELAVFSEVYYPPAKGWNCYLNGEKMPMSFTKADYLLRAIPLPPGKNQKFEMRFEPFTYYYGEKVSMFASILALLGLFGGLFLFFKTNGLPEAANLVETEPAVSDKPAAKAPIEGKAKVKKGKK